MLCPVCNGLTEVSVQCPTCKSPLKDQGKELDRLDDYSAYEEVDTVKLADGIPDDEQNHRCPHATICPECNWEGIVLVEEWPEQALNYDDQHDM
ncbi:hypothetical protein [Texcoconibacillus texcoconensis]|uniref:RNA polymerase subunit RPABC4/transcription elongation factor Spt4 n=1 Tax=Texcoconibacillus texcoconensis TaxID=1095777 RepID=A0A840QPG7_9BACI|nr:hypothetical protein [Texcoconibacillus texcoconensis]MBB5173265.1 RNA polymerase subunit RPABC4/transcription elongation factor Spt4 [Texcoconibacillus texcoconensis]